MHTKLVTFLSVLTGFLLPITTHAAEVGEKSSTLSITISFTLFILISLFLSKAWTGIMTTQVIDEGAYTSLENHKHFLPSVSIMIAALLGTVLLFVISNHTITGIAPFNTTTGSRFVAAIFTLFGIVWLIAYIKWPRKSQKYLFACIMGTVLTFALISFHASLVAGRHGSPFVMALAGVCTVIAWRFLFGPWNSKVKVTLLATFIFWVGIHLIFKENADNRLAKLIAIAIAMVPAGIWCALFLEYHKQRKSLVILMFFSGMLSTAPILFYDSMVRAGVQFDFFLFKIVPQSFIGSSNAFVSSSALAGTGIQTKVLSALVSFMLVGLIEEVSKFWVLKKSGESEFTSIDDVMQLAIIVAIGFAFAENVLNPQYFMGFVKQYLVSSEGLNWGGFLGNVLGRSVLTNMVHIVSTGVFGYFFGFAIFARPVLREKHENGKRLLTLGMLQRFFQVPEKMVYKKEMIIIGAVTSITLHGFFNFIVTLPDILPGNPRTLGDIFGSAPDSMMHMIALLMIPSLFYVVGGFWLLSTLFYKKECMKERGHLIKTDTYVTSGNFAT